MMRWGRFFLSAMLLGAAPSVSAGAAADAPPTSQPKQSLDDAARQLGDLDADVRERAAATLRSAGPAAEAALRAVAESGEPEAARRARALLREIRQPEPAEPPLPEFDEITRYRNANEDAKAQIIGQMGGGGTFRPGVLVRLWAEEEDDERRASMFRAMQLAPAAYASALVGHGNEPAAERLLEEALAQGNTDAAAPYAALAMLRGTVAATIDRWSNRAPAADGGETVVATVLARLHRAAGDAAAAAAAARRTGDPALIEEMLVDAGDWRALAEFLETAPAPNIPVPVPGARAGRPKHLGKLAAAYHLAGDGKAFDGVIERMGRAANADTVDDVAYAMLLAGRFDEGARVLEGAGGDADAGEHLATRMKLLATREKWDDAWALLASQDAARTEAAMKLRIVSAEMYYALGEEKQASDLLARVAGENLATPSGAIDLLLGGAYRRMGQTDLAWQHFGAAVRAEAKEPGQGQRAAWTAFYIDDDGDGDADVGGSNLWELLKDKYPGESVDQRFDRARAIVDETAGVDDIADIVADAKFVNPFARRNARNSEPSRRYRAYASNLVRLVAQRMRDAGRAAEADEYLAKAAERAPAPELSAALHLRAGDWAADAGRWADAATAYARAWNADRTRSAPLYLRAWALGRAGWHARAGELMNLAHEIPLADAWRRQEALRTLQERRMYGEVSREAAVALRTARQDQYAAHFAMQLAADHPAPGAGGGDAVAWRERMLYNLMGVFDLTEPLGYLRVAHSLHRERAKALLAKADVEGASREVAACQAILPGDVLVAIDVVAEFERLGDRARADAAYDDAKRTHEAVVAKYPGAANHRNDLAWMAVNCGRDLDAALAHATRAVELRPKNAAYIDTLAEVQFKRGDIDGAIKTMKRCVELEPRQLRHREQLDRFEAARRGETRPIPQS